MRHHPDRPGGSEDSMKRVNAQWDVFKNSRDFEKLSMAFLDELAKIAGREGLVLSQLARREIMPPVTQAITRIEAEAKERWQHLG